MFFKRISLYLTASILVATSLFLSACQEGGHVNKVKVVPAAKTTSTVDGRAELTAEEKLNVKDPATLEPYKHLLEPVFSKINRPGFISWPDLFRLKTWIIGPIDDKKDFSSAIASTTAEAAGYIAHQTKYEIFINQGLYGKLNEEQQADLLLNEFLTELYTLKSFKTADLCNLLEENKLKVENCRPKTAKAEGFVSEDEDPQLSEDAEPDQNYRNKAAMAGSRRNDQPQKVNPEKKAVLDRLDYDKIAVVKKFILEQRAALKVEELINKMSANGFDTRIFSFKIIEGSDVDTDNQIGKQSVASLFDQLQNLEKKSLNCHSLQLGETTACKLQTNKKSNYLSFKVTVEGGAILSDMIYQASNARLLKLNEQNSKGPLYLIPLISAGLKNRVPGQTYLMNYLVVSKKTSKTDANQPWELQGLLSAPGVVDEVYEEEVNNEIRVRCKGSLTPLKDKNIKTDMVLISETDHGVQELLKQIADIKVTPPCW